MKKIVLLFVLEKDKRFVKIPAGVDVKIIGQRAQYLHAMDLVMDLDGYDHAILFGSCGLLDDRLSHNYLYMPMMGHWYDGLPCVELVFSVFTSDYVVKSSYEKYRLFSEGYSIVDMEDGMINVLCDFGDCVVSYRYGVCWLLAGTVDRRYDLADVPVPTPTGDFTDVEIKKAHRIAGVGLHWTRSYRFGCHVSNAASLTTITVPAILSPLILPLASA